MPCRPRSDHARLSAVWIDLADDQIYKLRVRIWDRVNGKDQVSAGSVDFSYGPYNAEFRNGGGMLAAASAAGVLLTVDTDRNSDLQLTPSSLGPMYLSLELLLPPAGIVRESYALSIDSTMPPSQRRVRLTTLYCATTGNP